MRISQASAYSGELLTAINGLLSQLSANPTQLSAAHLKELLASPNGQLFTVADGGKIYGMGMLSFYRIPSGLMAHIDDMVIDVSRRGKGWGEKLLRLMLQAARQRGADAVLLSSHPKRLAANRLYEKVGFTRHQTNMYLLRLN